MLRGQTTWKRVSQDNPVIGANQYMIPEVTNIVNYAREVEAGNVAEWNVHSMKEIHRQLFQDFEESDLRNQNSVSPGQYRQHGVYVGRYIAPNWGDCPLFDGRVYTWLHELKSDLTDETTEISATLLTALMAHLYSAWIHPFSDGNGRTSRLVEHRLLVDGGIPLPAAHIPASYYWKNRPSYYNALDMSSRIQGGIVQFLQFALEGYTMGFSDLLERIAEGPSGDGGFCD